MPLISASACSSSHSSWSVPWATSSGASGWSVGEARQARGPLVELGVELHRARAERVEARVDRVVELRQVDVVADDLGLVELRQRRRRRRAARRPGCRSRASFGGCGILPPPRPGRERSNSVGWRRSPTTLIGPPPPRDPVAAARAGSARSWTASSAARRRREALDLVVGRDLRRADEQRVGERRLVGQDVGERQAGEDAALEEPAMDGPRVRDADGELVEVRRPRGSAARRRPRGPPPARAARAAPRAATSRRPCGPIVAR